MILQEEKKLGDTQELSGLIGKPYTPETARLMRYGGTVNSKGLIVEVDTKERKSRRCINKDNTTKKLSFKKRLMSLFR